MYVVIALMICPRLELQLDLRPSSLARESEGPGIAAKMRELCAALGTPAQWEAQERLLAISVRAAGMQAAPPQVNTAAQPLIS